MANIKASKKDARTSAIKAQANRSVRSAVNTRVCKIAAAINNNCRAAAIWRIAILLPKRMAVH